MINKIYIKDFAIIDEIEIPINKGFTVITGETGSGKSILLQALNVSLGGKSSKTMVRSNSDRAVVETDYNNNIYRRIISVSGRAKSYINDEPIAETAFRKASDSLVDFHGQHEQQLILNENSHIDYLDAFCRIEDTVHECKNLFLSIKNKEKQLSISFEKKHNAEKDKELLTFQVNEIKAIEPKDSEDIELEEELSALKHFDEIVEIANRLSLDLLEDDDSVYNRLSSSIFSLGKVSHIDKRLSEIIELLNVASVNIQEGTAGITEYVNSLNHDKIRLEEIQDRLGAIDNLKRKYGGSIESILYNKKQIEDMLGGFSTLEEEINSISTQIEEEKKEYQQIAIYLNKARRKGIDKLSTAVEKEMRLLNMPDAEFKIHISQKDVSESYVMFKNKYVEPKYKGFDDVRFLLSANPGEKLKPLVEIASGGEISRIMLAIKTVFQQTDPVQTLIFDEIDSGISGSAATKVANSLANLAKTKQVICITHLPQIAQNAVNHLHISKTIKNGQTYVNAIYLNKIESNNIVRELSASNQYNNQE